MTIISEAKDKTQISKLEAWVETYHKLKDNVRVLYKEEQDYLYSFKSSLSSNNFKIRHDKLMKYKGLERHYLTRIMDVSDDLTMLQLQINLRKQSSTYSYIGY